MCLDIVCDGFLPLLRLQQARVRKGRVQKEGCRSMAAGEAVGRGFRKLESGQPNLNCPSVPVLRREGLK